MLDISTKEIVEVFLLYYSHYIMMAMSWSINQMQFATYLGTCGTLNYFSVKKIDAHC